MFYFTVHDIENTQTTLSSGFGRAHGFGTGNPGIFVDVAERLHPVDTFSMRGRASRFWPF